MTPLHQAIVSRDVSAVRRLLASGKNQHNEGINEAISSVSTSGTTPLHIAVSASSAAMVEMLLSLGAKVDARDADGREPLMDCLGWRDENTEEKVALLVSHGANINSKDKYGNTLLHLAVLNGTEKLLEFLAKMGIDLNIQNVKGRTALHEGVIEYCSLQERAPNIIYYVKDGGYERKLLFGQPGWDEKHREHGKPSLDRIKCLLRLGAKVDTQDAKGINPLYSAWHCKELVNILNEFKNAS